MGLILDTSALLASEQQKFDLAGLCAANPDETFYVSSITAAELLRGVEAAKGAARRKARAQFVDALLDQIETLDLDAEVARQLAPLWALGGNSLKPSELIVAATAIHHGLALVTMRAQPFGAVPRLKLAEIRPYLRTNGNN